MNGGKYLADTNTFIFLLDKHPSVSPLLDSEWSYSFITELEMLGRFQITSSELKLVKSLLLSCNKITYSEEIADKAIALRQQYRVKSPDCIIAATALVNSLPLVTFDKGFGVIKQLDIVLLDY